MLGTRGVPAAYGGFETAVEEIGSRLVDLGHEVLVYCRNPGQTRATYKGMKLVNLPALRRRSLETLSHTGLSAVHALFDRPDCAIVFNSANAPFVPLLQAGRVPVAVHVDGLEYLRGKWSGYGKRYYLAAERFVAVHADAVIADARAIGEIFFKKYGRSATFIPYGAPLVERSHNGVESLQLQSRKYHLVVARFEPENNVDMILDGYSQSAAALPLVVVGGAPYSTAYGDQVARAASSDARIRLIGRVWDQALLDQLYANCRSYLHGHSVGGTNPSLLRAMGAGSPVTAFDVVFNREVTAGFARYFGSPAEVASCIELDEASVEDALDRGNRGRDHVARTYQWDEVARRYEGLAQGMLACA